MVNQVPLSDEQSRTLYAALKCYAEQLNQPSEMAMDNTEARNKVNTLLQYIENNTGLGTKRYRIVNGNKVPMV